MIDEGYIKYNVYWERTSHIQLKYWNLIEQWRYRLRYLGYIGEYEGGIGFGNISIRLNAHEFLITATSTGKKQRLTYDDFAIVREVNFDTNFVHCEGPAQASSEALTHAMLYACNQRIAAIVHVHEPLLWAKLCNRVPTTGASVPYGTVEMAQAVRSILEVQSSARGCIAMAGHQDGLIYYGENLDTACEILMNHHHQLRISRD